MSGIAIADLSIRYPGAPAPVVADLSLTVAGGEIAALLGPSGAGKSSVLRAVAGLVTPERGTIAIGGRDMAGVAPERRGAVMMFQGGLLFPHMTVAENLGFALRMRGLPRAQIAARVAGMLDRMQLAGLADRRPAALSGGQQGRVALGRALLAEPAVLLLDEPLTGLDAHLRTDMRELIRTLHAQTGVTMLVVTHDQEDAVALAHRIVLMRDGRIAQAGAPADLFARPADAFVARFFGGCNFVAGAVQAGLFVGPLGPLRIAGGRPDGPAVLTIRPEAIRLGDPDPDDNTLPARIAAVDFLGARSRIALVSGAVTLMADLPPDRAAGLQPGQPVTLGLPQASLWALPA